MCDLRCVLRQVLSIRARYFAIISFLLPTIVLKFGSPAYVYLLHSLICSHTPHNHFSVPLFSFVAFSVLLVYP